MNDNDKLNKTMNTTVLTETNENEKPHEDAPQQHEVEALARPSTMPEGVRSYDASMIKNPYLKVVHPLSKTATDDGFKPGQLVVGDSNQNTLLADKEAVVKLIPLYLDTYYEEEIPYGEMDVDNKPRVWPNYPAALKAGFVTDYGAPNRCRPAARCDCLVSCPPELKNFEIGGEAYTYVTAIWSKTAFNATAGAILKVSTGEQSLLRDGIRNGIFDLTVRKKKSGKNEYLVPMLQCRGRLTERQIADVLATGLAA